MTFVLGSLESILYPIFTIHTFVFLYKCSVYRGFYFINTHIWHLSLQWRSPPSGSGCCVLGGNCWRHWGGGTSDATTVVDIHMHAIKCTGDATIIVPHPHARKCSSTSKRKLQPCLPCLGGTWGMYRSNCPPYKFCGGHHQIQPLWVVRIIAKQAYGKERPKRLLNFGGVAPEARLPRWDVLCPTYCGARSNRLHHLGKRELANNMSQ